MLELNKNNYNKQKKQLLYLIVGVTLYIFINILVNNITPTPRIDYTENKLYSLSVGSKEILAKIDKKIELHFFLSEKLTREVPGFATYGQRVSDLLNEIVAQSNDKIILSRYNPKPYSVEEEQAKVFGMQTIPIDENQVGYFGLAGKNSAKEDIKLIEFFHQDRESHLEYDIISLIHTLSKNKRDVIGVMGSLPIMGDIKAHMSGLPMIPWSVLARIQSDFKFTNLPEVIDDLPREIKTMMLVHPRNMNERSIYEFEQFLFRGGKAIVFIDPKAEGDRNVAPDDTSSSSDALDRLFDVWGIDTPSNQLVTDRALALQINAGTPIQPIPAEYLLWLGVKPQYISQEDPITSQLQTLNIATSGYIRQNKNSPLKVKALIKSSKNSNTLSASNVEGTQPNVLALLENFKANKEEYILAARLSGNPHTAFPDGPPARIVKKNQEELDNSKILPQLMNPLKPINVILVADSDLLQDRFWLIKKQFYGRNVEQEISANGQFVLNALENLTGSDSLLELRSRGGSLRPLDKIEEIKRSAKEKLQDTQRQMQNKLAQTQEKIDEIKGIQTTKNPVSGELEVQIHLTQEQRNEINNMRNEMLQIRKQLRTIQLEMNEDVEKLEGWLQFINIGLIPILFLIVAFLTGVLNSMKYRNKTSHI